MNAIKMCTLQFSTGNRAYTRHSTDLGLGNRAGKSCILLYMYCIIRFSLQEKNILALLSYKANTGKSSQNIGRMGVAGFRLGHRE